MTFTSTSAGPPARWLIALSAITVFFVVDTIGLHIFRAVAGDWKGWSRVAAVGVLGYGLYALGPAVLAALLFGRRRVASALGVDKPIGLALLVGAAGTSVFFIGLALTTPVSRDPVVSAILRQAVFSGLAEELLYRALLFGFLFRYAGWGFLPASLLGAVVFGAAHIAQGDNAMEALLIFLLTGLGGLWFSWLYAEWRFNIWVPTAFHVLMNAAWIVFPVDDTALGTGFSVALRVACIVLSIAITALYWRARGGLAVRGSRWWRGPPPIGTASS